MENAVISFPCPVCEIQLTVPARLAGVTGPCPSCRSQIQAVHPPLVLPEIPQVGPVIIPPLERLPTEVCAGPTTPDAPPPGVDAGAPQTVEEALPAGSPSGLAPVASASSTLGAALEVPQPQRGSGFKRLLLFLFFIIAVVTIGVGVVTFLRDRSEKQRSKHSTSKIPVKTSFPREITRREPLDPPKLPEPPILTPRVPPPAEQVIVDAKPSSAERTETPTPSQAATKVLENFLAAQTLAERLPLVVTQTPETMLADSCLAGLLPLAEEIFIEAIENNAAEQVVNFYHHVTFDTDDTAKKSQTILIQQRGAKEPKVVVDPFLDSYGGRLAAYAKAPSDRPGTFQVTILPLASCSEESVPSREEKLTLKLLPQDGAKEIALAFFSKQSKIARTLEDGTYSLSYGKAKACTVVLRWNNEERPGKPYLEALAIKTLNWNP